MAQGRQRQVNLGGFLKTITSGTRFGDSFRTSQIDHVKLADTNMLLAIAAKFTALNSDSEKRVRSGGVCIHHSLAD